MSRFPLFALAALAAASLAGCDNKPAPTSPASGADPATTAAKGKGAETKDHEHGPGPHGGVIGEFGGKYHFEFTVNHKTQEATVYILGGDAKTTVSIKAESLTLSINKPMFRVELMPVPQVSDPPGTSSRFVGKHEKLGVEQEFTGEVSGDVDGRPLVGEFEEKPEGKK